MRYLYHQKSFCSFGSAQLLTWWLVCSLCICFFIHVSTAHPHSINNSIKARAASVHCHCLFIVLSCSYPHKSEVETGFQIPHWLFLIRAFQTSLLSWILTAQSTKRVHTPKSTGDLRIRSIDLRGGRRYFRCKTKTMLPYTVWALVRLGSTWNSKIK